MLRRHARAVGLRRVALDDRFQLAIGVLNGSIVWFELEILVQSRQGIRGVLFLDVGHRQVFVAAGVFRIDGDRAFEGLERLVYITGLAIDHPEVVVRLGIARIHFHDFSKTLDCLWILFELSIGNPQVVVRLEHPRVEIDCGLVGFHRRLVHSKLPQGLAKIVLHRWQVRVEIDRLGIIVYRFEEIPGLFVNYRALDIRVHIVGVDFDGFVDLFDGLFLVTQFGIATGLMCVLAPDNIVIRERE